MDEIRFSKTKTKGILCLQASRLGVGHEIGTDETLLLGGWKSLSFFQTRLTRSLATVIRTKGYVRSVGRSYPHPAKLLERY
jgi:hypothetical protein